MKNMILICYCSIFIILSCDAPVKKKSLKHKETTLPSFVLNGVLNDYLSDKVYLNKIIEQSIYPIDSAIVKNNEFTFKGIVEYPERFALSFENYSKTIILILENTNFQVKIDPNYILDPTITGSDLNTLLIDYKTASKHIFKKIDYLFPQFQKARLENDVTKLEEIGNKMELIENEFRDYTYDFINSNRNSFVSVMILRDQLKASNMDTLRIKKAYEILSDNVKRCPDAFIIAETLNLY